MIFIIGVGRSGTNLLGHILNSHDEILCDLEKEPQFTLSVEACIYGKKYHKLVAEYKKRIKQVHPFTYATKDHANLWHIKDLLKDIPGSKALCIERHPYAVVASSLQHKGVRHWVENYKQYPPNSLSGNLNLQNFVNLSITERLTCRWLLHHNKILELHNHPDILHIGFSDLLLQPRIALDEIQDFLELDTLFPMFKPNLDVLTKYEDILNTQQAKEINEILWEQSRLIITAKT